MSQPSPSLSIGERINEIKQTLPAGVRLVAVSKFHPSEAIVEAYESGQRLFGESRVQELSTKHAELGEMYLTLYGISLVHYKPIRSNISHLS